MELSAVIKDHKRKPLEREIDKDLTPAGKRYCQNIHASVPHICIFNIFCVYFRKMTRKEQQNQAQCHVISSPFSVTGSTQMFTTPKRPIPHTRPLSEIGKWKIK